MSLKKGDAAPDFALRGHDEKDHKLSDYRGRNVVLLFYPLDFSPVCTVEHACFRDDLSRFNELGAQVFGISVDSTWTHKAFAKEMGLEYPLLADFHPRGEVASSFGLYLEEKGITARATVVVDKEGRIAEILNYDIPQTPETGPVLEALQGLS